MSTARNPNVVDLTFRDLAAMEFMSTFLTGSVLPPGFDAKEQLEYVGQRAYEAAEALLKARPR